MTRDKVTYEWHIECGDDAGDVHNVDFADSYVEALRSQAMWAKDEDYARVDIALVRTEGNDDDGINWRGYAYLDRCELEPVFSTFHDETGPARDGPDVPQRFFKEVAKAA